MVQRGDRELTRDDERRRWAQRDATTDADTDADTDAAIDADVGADTIVDSADRHDEARVGRLPCRRMHDPSGGVRAAAAGAARARTLGASHRRGGARVRDER